jgi:regulatory protein
MAEGDRSRKCMDQALGYLDFKSRTAGEMTAYLEKKGYASQEIQGTLKKLQDYHYIDDRAYIKQAVSANAAGNRYGRGRLLRALRQRGICEEDLADFEAVYSPETERACGEEQLAKALRRYQSENRSKKKEKIYAYLLRKGYGYDMIKELLNSVSWQADEEDTEENGDARRDDLVRWAQKYLKMQRNKGYTGRELTARVSRNLASRGFSYTAIRDILDELAEDHYE